MSLSLSLSYVFDMLTDVKYHDTCFDGGMTHSYVWHTYA